jgi:hypothetical protein
MEQVACGLYNKALSRRGVACRCCPARSGLNRQHTASEITGASFGVRGFGDACTSAVTGGAERACDPA